MKLEAAQRLKAAACPNFLKVFGLRFIQQIQKKLPDLDWESQFKQAAGNKNAWLGSFKTAKTPKAGGIITSVLKEAGMRDAKHGCWYDQTGSVLVSIQLDLDRSDYVLINMTLTEVERD